MTPNASRPLRTRHARHARKREGIALILVMMIMVMATASGIFAVQTSAWESAAAGNSRRAMRTKLVTESAVSAVNSVLNHMSAAGVYTAMNWAGRVPTNTTAFGVPALPATAQFLPAFTGTSIVSALPGDPLFDSTPFVSDGTMVDPRSRVDAFTPAFTVVTEGFCLPVNNPTDRAAMFITTSSYGQYTAAVDATTAPGGVNDLRSYHDSLGLSRGYVILVDACNPGSPGIN